MSKVQPKDEEGGRLDRLNNEACMVADLITRIAQSATEFADRSCGVGDMSVLVPGESLSANTGNRKVELGIIGDTFGYLSTIAHRCGEIEEAIKRF